MISVMEIKQGATVIWSGARCEVMRRSSDGRRLFVSGHITRWPGGMRLRRLWVDSSEVTVVAPVPAAPLTYEEIRDALVPICAALAQLIERATDSAWPHQPSHHYDHGAPGSASRAAAREARQELLQHHGVLGQLMLGLDALTRASAPRPKRLAEARAIQLALEHAAADQRAALDAKGDGTETVADLVLGLRSALCEFGDDTDQIEGFNGSLVWSAVEQIEQITAYATGRVAKPGRYGEWTRCAMRAVDFFGQPRPTQPTQPTQPTTTTTKRTKRKARKS